MWWMNSTATVVSVNGGSTRDDDEVLWQSIHCPSKLYHWMDSIRNYQLYLSRHISDSIHIGLDHNCCRDGMVMGGGGWGQGKSCTPGVITSVAVLNMNILQFWSDSLKLLVSNCGQNLTKLDFWQFAKVLKLAGLAPTYISNGYYETVIGSNISI